MNRNIALITSNPSLVESLLERLEQEASGVRVAVAVFVHPGTALRDRIRDLWRLLVRRARINGTHPAAQFIHHMAYKWFSRGDGSRQPTPAQRAESRESAYMRLATGRRLVQTKTVNHRDVIEAINQAQVELTVVFGADVFRRSTLAQLEAPLVNVHCSDPSLVRGMPPVFWEVRDNRDEIVITVHDLEPRLDAGAIREQRAVPIAWRPSLRETLAATRDRIDPAVGDLLSDAIPQILDGHAPRTSFDPGPLRTHPTLGEILRAERMCRLRHAERERPRVTRRDQGPRE